MAGAYAHISVVNQASLLQKLQDNEFSIEAQISLQEYLPYLELGSVSPDYPYLAYFNKHKKWADLMHLGMETKKFLEIGINEVKNIKNPDHKHKAFSWLCGIAAHITTDVVIHPVVELKVGPYEGNETEHRVCEMHQDVYIYDKVFNYGHLKDTEHLSLIRHSCSHDSNDEVLDITICEIWDEMLKSLSEKEYTTNKPEINKWHKAFIKIVSLIEELTHLKSLSRHIGLLDEEAGNRYPDIENVNKKEYIENLNVPEGQAMHYDQLFEKAVDQVIETFKVLDNAIFKDKDNYIAYFKDWDLDTGRDKDDNLEYWS